MPKFPILVKIRSMLRNYIKTAFRNMGRNKLFTGLNIFGLATGLACSILIFLWVQDELSYDRFNPGADKIFRLTAQFKNSASANTPYAFAAAIKKEIPVIKNATRISSDQKIITASNRKFDEKRLYYADSNFLRIFNYPLVRGSLGTVLSKPNTAVLTEATAVKYFGSVDKAVGQSILLDADSTVLLVTGVLQNIPANSHLQFDLLLSIDEWGRSIDPTQAWKYFDSYVYFQLADGVAPDPAILHAIEQQLNGMRNGAIANTNAVPVVVSVQPLAEIHLRSHFSNDVEGQGNIQYVRIFTLVDLFVIFIACINFMNLATALSGKRAREVGLRKTVGALRGQLIFQFIGESMLLAFIGLVLALGLVYVALPFFNTLAGKRISVDLLDMGLAGKIVGITLVTGLLAGCYPAFYLSSFSAINVIKGARFVNVKGGFLRNGLVVLQFSISVILMISTVIIYDQLHYIHNRDIGFNRENLLYVPLPDVGARKMDNDALRAALSQSAQPADFTIVSNLPTDLSASRPLTWRGMEKGELVIASRLNVDEQFIRTFGMTMAAGRFFSADFPGDDSGYVVNETAAHAMHLTPEAALGRFISIRSQEGPIIGVIKDFNFKPVHQAIEPLVIRTGIPGDYLVLRSSAAGAGQTMVGGVAPTMEGGAVPTVADGLQRTMATAKACFQRVYGDAPFSYGFIDQDLDRLYAAENRMGSLLNVFSILSIVISCLGLFGLATFATQTRRREIGVRKVLGAGEAGIFFLLAREFLRLVVVSLLIAFPIAWYAMHQWLEGYVYKVAISGWVFAGAGVLALAVAFVTVSYQTIRAAMANPVHALRGE
jgi:putative ABC transport system permease protein